MERPIPFLADATSFVTVSELAGYSRWFLQDRGQPKGLSLHELCQSLRSEVQALRSEVRFTASIDLPSRSPSCTRAANFAA